MKKIIFLVILVIGIFLGYPTKDVKGFIKNKGA